jgi:glycosyltransferase involved in cell wall biosynthesis
MVARFQIFYHPMISVCILVKNGERSLKATLDSLKKFPEVVLLDTGSTDHTLDIARQFQNVSIWEVPFTGFGVLRNEAAEKASHDWILAVDSDEVLSPALQEELLTLSPAEDSLYEIDFHNYYNGKRILGCGWHPERHIRLYHRKKTRFSPRAVHEEVIADGCHTLRLRSPIEHTPYLSISDFLAKMQHYSDLFAKEMQGKKKSSFMSAFLHGSWAFFKSYLLKKGIFLGKEGFIISSYNASTAFYKYLKLAERS